MKTKPILIIVTTLIIGFVLGMLTSAQIRHFRLNQFRVFFSEDRFRDGFYRTIQPDEQQKAKIDIVLDKYARINGDLQRSFRNELDSTMKAFHREIDSYLSKDQIRRLKEMDARMQRMIRRNRMVHKNDSVPFMDRRHHFPPDGPFPGDEPGRPHHDFDPDSTTSSDSIGKK
jgi:hypothetical protein